MIDFRFRGPQFFLQDILAQGLDQFVLKITDFLDLVSIIFDPLWVGFLDFDRAGGESLGDFFPPFQEPLNGLIFALLELLFSQSSLLLIQMIMLDKSIEEVFPFLGQLRRHARVRRNLGRILTRC